MNKQTSLYLLMIACACTPGLPSIPNEDEDSGTTEETSTISAIDDLPHGDGDADGDGDTSTGDGDPTTTGDGDGEGDPPELCEGDYLDDYLVCVKEVSTTYSSYCPDECSAHTIPCVELICMQNCQSTALATYFEECVEMWPACYDMSTNTSACLMTCQAAAGPCYNEALGQGCVQEAVDACTQALDDCIGSAELPCPIPMG